jgi:hypothetical protein
VTDRETGRTEVRRVPMPAATTVAQAQAELRRLQTQREDGELPVGNQPASAGSAAGTLPTQAALSRGLGS